MKGGRAWFSEDEAYRYALLRCIEEHDNERSVCFVMLNPSTATAEINDATIRRCMGYARRWEYGSLTVVNLFAFRATDPKVMKAAPDPVGPENDEYIRRVAGAADLVIAAWGAHGAFHRRDEAVRRLLREIGKEPQCLTTTVEGQPSHPLRLAYDLKPHRYWRPGDPL